MTNDAGRRDSFLTGAFLLAASSAVSRVLGAIARIPLARVMGDEGIGLYQMAYPIYSVMLALSTTGINIAVSKLVAEQVARGRWRTAQAIFRQAVRLLMIFGTLGAVTLAVMAGPISERIARDPRSYLSIVAVSPALFLVAMMAALRGLFQGLQDMRPTAWSQVVEQIIRVITMFALGLGLLPLGIDKAAAGAVFGAVTGAGAGLIYLGRKYAAAAVMLRRNAREARDDPGETAGAILRQIITVALPISLASIIMPLMQFIDMAVVPSRLQGLGLTMEQATGLYGQLSGMAYPLIYVPTIFTAGLTVSLVPAVSEARVTNPDWVRSRTQLATRLNLLVSIPSAVGLAVLASEISALLYSEPAAGLPLLWLAPGVVFLSVQMTSGAVLQGLGRSDLPVKHLLVGAMVKLALTWALTGTRLGIAGSALATVVGFAVNSYLNTAASARLTGESLHTLRYSVKPAIAAAAMGVAVHVSRVIFGARLGNGVTTVLAVGIGCAAYALVILALGAVTAAELAMVPLVGKLAARVLRRLGVLRK